MNKKTEKTSDSLKISAKGKSSKNVSTAKKVKTPEKTQQPKTKKSKNLYLMHILLLYVRWE